MINPVTFLVQTQDELKKVTWPTQKEVIRLTATVIIVSIIVGVFLGGLDFLLTKLTEIIIK
jgi:preprotein translocase SecE subunit